MSNDVEITQDKFEVNIATKFGSVELGKSDINVDISQKKFTVDITSQNYDIEFKGEMKYTQVEFKWAEVPENRNSPGAIGMMAMNDDYLYICFEANRWGRLIITKGW
jgi:hypothetical protein